MQTYGFQVTHGLDPTTAYAVKAWYGSVSYFLHIFRLIID